jgi:hypothetical protein
MIPPKTDPVWRLLVTGSKRVRSSNLAFDMLMSNCRIHCRHDSSPVSTARLAQHAFEFFTKYEEVLEEELKQLVLSNSLPAGGRGDAATDR